MSNWLQEHVWICTYIVAGLAGITFALNFIFKQKWKEPKGTEGRRVKNVKIKASRCRNSSVNQVAQDLTINNFRE